MGRLSESLAGACFTPSAISLFGQKRKNVAARPINQADRNAPRVTFAAVGDPWYWGASPLLDRVVIVSTMSVGGLKKRLPITALEQVSHKLDFLTYRGSHPQLQSIITLTGTHGTDRGRSWQSMRSPSGATTS